MGLIVQGCHIIIWLQYQAYFRLCTLTCCVILAESLVHFLSVSTGRLQSCVCFCHTLGRLALKELYNLIYMPMIYANFLDQSVTVWFLLCHSLCTHYADCAENLLKYFVISCYCKLNGNNQLVYNVHSLIHLATWCFGSHYFISFWKLSG